MDMEILLADMPKLINPLTTISYETEGEMIDVVKQDALYIDRKECNSSDIETIGNIAMNGMKYIKSEFENLIGGCDRLLYLSEYERIYVRPRPLIDLLFSTWKILPFDLEPSIIASYSGIRVNVAFMKDYISVPTELEDGHIMAIEESHHFINNLLQYFPERVYDVYSGYVKIGFLQNDMSMIKNAYLSYLYILTIALIFLRTISIVPAKNQGEEKEKER